jgi:hypothetical protein
MARLASPLLSCAGAGAEAPLPNIYLTDSRKERRAARLALSFDGAGSVAAIEDPLLFWSDESPIAGPRPMGVTDIAARDEVVGGVVVAVPVKVICDERITGYAISRLPLDDTLAPMAGMRPGADLVVKNKSVNRDDSRRRRNRVSGNRSHCRTCNSFSSVTRDSACVVTGKRAKAPRSLVPFRNEITTAVLTGPGFHGRDYTITKGVL